MRGEQAGGMERWVCGSSMEKRRMLAFSANMSAQGWHFSNGVNWYDIPLAEEH